MRKYTINLSTGTVRVMAKNRLEALRKIFGNKEEKKEVKKPKKKKQKNKD